MISSLSHTAGQIDGAAKRRISLRLPGKLRGKLKAYLLGFALLGSLAALSCTQGTYPVDIFYEMHYQQSYKSHDPPRLSSPASAVAFFPGPKSTSFNTGEHLFVVNCSMCHGLDAKGTGPVLTKLTSTYGYTPLVTPDLTTLLPAAITAFLLATERPFGPDSVMPPFGKLLSADERQAIADYIGTLPK